MFTKLTKLTTTAVLSLGLQSFAGTPIAAKSVGTTPPAAAADWKDHTISPVADLIYFEDPIVHTEITPTFMYQGIDDDYFTGGNTAIYGARLQYAVTPRLGLFLNKGGYMDYKNGLGTQTKGWANTGVGAKYMFIDDSANQFVLTGGLGYELPIGEKQLYWNNGDGEINAFVTTEKGWGDFHVMAILGLRAPIDTDANSTMLHYGVQADYYVSQFFIPFVQGVGYSVTKAGKQFPADSEGVDSQNFGAVNSEGQTTFLVGAGFRSKLTQTIDLGLAYQKGVNEPIGIFDDRWTVSVQFKF